MSISHVPELRTGSLTSAPDPKTANCVSCPVATTGILTGSPVSDDAFELILPVIVPGSTGSPSFSIGKPILLIIFFEYPLESKLVTIEVPAMVISFTISPVRKNENMEGIKRKIFDFSTNSGFCSKSQISLLIVLKLNGKTPASE